MAEVDRPGIAATAAARVGERASCRFSSSVQQVTRLGITPAASAFSSESEADVRVPLADRMYTPTLRAMIAKVIEQEAPIRDDLLVERVARAHGFGRSGRLARERVLSIARRTIHLQREDTGSTFAWPDAGAPARWKSYRAPATTADIRQIEEIAREELTAAICSCRGEDRDVEVARLFGVRRLSSAARARLRAAAPAQGHLG